MEMVMMMMIRGTMMEREGAPAAEKNGGLPD
jgi:hypothetical protein